MLETERREREWEREGRREQEGGEGRKKTEQNGRKTVMMMTLYQYNVSIHCIITINDCNNQGNSKGGFLQERNAFMKMTSILKPYVNFHAERDG